MHKKRHKWLRIDNNMNVSYEVVHECESEYLKEEGEKTESRKG